MSYVFMKVLETAPQRYDLGMRILTAGRLETAYAQIASQLQPGDRVLDVGCGTGSLAVRLSTQGCRVTGIDVSPKMLAQAREKAAQAGVLDRIHLEERGAVDIDSAFGVGSFDAVVCTLVLSELGPDERDYVLGQFHRILRPGGKLLVAADVVPDRPWARFWTRLLRLPFALAAFLLTQTTTRRVTGLRSRVEGAGFQVEHVQEYLMGTLQLMHAVRV